MAAAAPALNFNAALLARWQSAVRKGERLAFFTGTKGNQSILISVENHFLGAWMPISYLESPAEMLAASPWVAELDEVPWRAGEPFDLRTASGVLTDAARAADHKVSDDGGAVIVDIDPSRLPMTAAAPWTAAKRGGVCSGCQEPHRRGDQVQADGDGGLLCRDCGTGDDDEGMVADEQASPA
jgi:hypothetical protein